jgi:hypothetical protein
MTFRLLLLMLLVLAGCDRRTAAASKMDESTPSSQLAVLYSVEVASPDPERAIARDFDRINALLGGGSADGPCWTCRFLMGASNGVWDQPSVALSFGKIYAHLTDSQRRQMAETLANAWGAGTDVVRPVLSGAQPDQETKDLFIQAIVDLSQRLPASNARLRARCIRLVGRWATAEQQALAAQLIERRMPVDGVDLRAERAGIAPDAS